MHKATERDGMRLISYAYPTTMESKNGNSIIFDHPTTPSLQVILITKDLLSFPLDVTSSMFSLRLPTIIIKAITENHTDLYIIQRKMCALYIG